MCHTKGFVRQRGDVELYTKEVYTYSSQDRLLTHTHQIGTGGTPQLLASNTYDELGQLIGKNVGNTVATPLQKINYAYNIRGWLTEINKVATLQQGTDPKDLFGFKINYNTIDGDATAANKLYNGNIAETSWSTSPVVRTYGYKYDNLNRLKDATYQKAGLITSAYDENLTYDKNGNILTLKRKGDTDPQMQTIKIDDLTYTYKSSSSNQLAKVSDNPITATSGFKDGTNTGDDYTYDPNGNLQTDQNKNITAITYNHLNLPLKVTFGTTGNITYIYNAVGQKVQKTVTVITPASTTITNYLGGYQYQGVNGVTPSLQFFPTTEGYVKNASGVYSYVFNYTDHLGNVRLSYSDSDKNGQIATTEILEESNYYPFGLKHNGYTGTNLQPGYKYKYNGKELQDELGLNMYDYGARNYDPALGRWMNIDPLAEVSRRFSPFTYALDNPVYFIDPDGMKAEAGQSGNYYDWDEKQYKNKDTGKTVDAEVAIASHSDGGDIDPPGKKNNNVLSRLRDRTRRWVNENIRQPIHEELEPFREGIAAAREVNSEILHNELAPLYELQSKIGGGTGASILAGRLLVSKGVSVIGPRANYREFAIKIGANFLNVTDEAWTMRKNVAFLQGVVKRGDDVIMSVKFNPARLDPKSVLAQEIRYLIRNGYSWAENYSKLIKK